MVTIQTQNGQITVEHGIKAIKLTAVVNGIHTVMSFLDPAASENLETALRVARREIEKKGRK